MVQRDVHVPVLIVGGGYAGLASALFLAAHGVRSLLVDRRPGVSVQGRARGINQRTIEIYRPLGLQDAVVVAGAPFEHDAGVARCETLAGAWEWIVEEDSPATWPALGAGGFVMADQNTVEPILIEAAQTRGATHRFASEVVDVEPHEDGVSATVVDRRSRERERVSADFLVAADGHRSPIREQLGIGRRGPGVTQHWISIVFDADLSAVIERRALFWIVVNPELGFGGFVTTATPGRWAVSTTYDPSSQTMEDFTPQRCAEIARAAVGLPELTVNVVDVAGWEQATAVAERFRHDRAFLVGDSAHVWPPAGAMGANSAVHDAHNLAWKLAAVINDQAGEGLLDSYDAERRPVAAALAYLVERRQRARFGSGQDPDELDEAVATLGQRYSSGAIVGGDPQCAPFAGSVTERAEPGARFPHLWVELDGDRVAVHDLFHDAFVVLAGTDGQAWTRAAAEVAAALRIPLRQYRVGRRPDQADLVDTDERWSAVGPGAHGAVLIRPDGYVAWLASGPAPNPSAMLADALTHVLHRSSSTTQGGGRL